MDYDVIIVGSGLSGLYTALTLHERHRVLLVTKGELTHSNSYMAQGGIAFSADSMEQHYEDSYKIGHGLNHRKHLQHMVKKSQECINNLIRFGVQFDQNEQGDYHLTREGGHSRPRILHHVDETGRHLIDTLLREVKKGSNITLLPQCTCVDLLIEHNRCMGIKAFYQGKIHHFHSHHTVFATGGLGSLYTRTTNHKTLLGDGIGIAKRHGIPLNDLEFVQFHPTAFYHTDPDKIFLMTEALRGEGAHLVNHRGKRFAFDYHPDGELAGRDQVTYAICHELEKSQSPQVYLDISHLSSSYVKKRFPYVYKMCLDLGYDLTKEPIPVAPVQHYTLGGIKVNHKGQTTLSNFYACGECASTGVHGANRLASNSLLECVVFAQELAEEINNQYCGYKFDDQDLLEQIQEQISRSCGVTKNKTNLLQARHALMEIKSQLEDNPTSSLPYYTCLNSCTTALALVDASLTRTHSIGCFYIERS